MIVVGNQLMQAKPGDNIELFFDSPGGIAEVGTVIADKLINMQANNIKVRCVALRAASAAFMIWIACKDRAALAYGKLLFHYPYTHVEGPMRLKDYIEGIEPSKKIEEDFRRRWNAALTPYVSTDEQEKAAQSDRMFYGNTFCNVWAKGFCEVIYKYEHLEK